MGWNYNIITLEVKMNALIIVALLLTFIKIKREREKKTSSV